MPVRKGPPRSTPPDLSPERAYSALSIQLVSLQELKNVNYKDGRVREGEWSQYTEKIFIRTFGDDSINKKNFLSARGAGDNYYILYAPENPAIEQQNYEARIQAYESCLKSCLEELKLDLPKPEIQEVFEPGQEYEFYRSVKTILGLAVREIFVIDPYISTEIFDVYADAIPRTVSFRLLTTKVPSPVLSLAQKYASGRNFQMRDSKTIHDRVLFADSRVWMCGQSFKDAAKTKPTYIVEHDEPSQRMVYESLWAKALKIA